MGNTAFDGRVDVREIFVRFNVRGRGTAGGCVSRFRLATREGACDRLEQASVSGVTPEELKAVCLSFAGAREEFPFDEANSVFKVAGKIFALSRLNGVPLRISLKCDPSLAIQLRTSYASITGGYHLNKRHWNTVVLDGSVPDQLLRDMIEDSYDLVVAGLPLAQRERLGWVALSHER
jgi:predicted DNA-binding protein (MmcQ/YjbR family)